MPAPAPRLHAKYVPGETCAACGGQTQFEVCPVHGDNDECPQKPGYSHTDVHACPCTAGGAI